MSQLRSIVFISLALVFPCDAAQLAPGGKVHFAKCSLEMATELRRDARERLNAALRGIAWEYQRK